MQVEADVLLDRRRLIEWIFEPLLSLAGRAVMDASLLDALQLRLRAAGACRCSCRPRRPSAASRAWRWSRASTAIASTSPTLRRRFTRLAQGRDARRPDAGRRPAAPRAARRCALELDELPQLRAAVHPALGPEPLRGAEAVADARGAVIHDPGASACGACRWPRSRSISPASRSSSRRTADFQPARRAPTRRACASSSGRVAGLKRSLAQVFMLALALQAFALLTPFYMQWVVDGALVSADRDLLTMLGLGFLLLVADPGGDRRDPLVGGAATSAHAQPAVARERLLAPAAAAGELVREAPPRRRGVALRRGAARSSAR